MSLGYGKNVITMGLMQRHLHFHYRGFDHRVMVLIILWFTKNKKVEVVTHNKPGLAREPVVWSSLSNEQLCQ